MVAEEHRTWLYVIIPIYFVILACSAAWAYKRMERMEHDHVADKLSSHYLGGRMFGPILTAGTVFASLFSGYTVVGIPNEAYKVGFDSLRWMSTTAAIALGYHGTGMRLRKASMVRNHQSPVDLITDRYQSQILRYTILFIQLLTTVIYLSAQVIALKSTFNAMFGIPTDDAWPVIIIMIIILIFEWVGGLSSVALTDGIQGCIMLISFLILPVVIKTNFGGWTEMAPDNYPAPEFYQTPTEADQWKFWQFSFINFSFFTLPHFLQRTYAAQDLSSLKAGYAVVVIGPWITMLGGVFLGTVGVSMLAGEDGSYTEVASPFSAILEAVMDLGGFAKFMAMIAFAASLAAIMSTADSLIIAASHLATVEIFYPMFKTTDPNRVAWVGRCVSLVVVVLALVIGIFWTAGVSALGAIQFPITIQGVPAFLFALFATNKRTDIHPWCLALSAWVGVIYCIAIYFAYIRDNSSAAPIDAGITGIAIQVVLLVLFETTRRVLFNVNEQLEEQHEVGRRELWYPGRPSFDVPCTARFGDRILTPSMMWKMMDGIHEPMTNIYFMAFMIASITFITPMVPPTEPADPLDASVINGLPWWALKIMILCLVPYMMNLYVVLRMPNKFPDVDPKKIELEGYDPDLVEMSMQELGQRASYDATNASVTRRRSTIRSSMKSLGGQSAKPSDGARRISSMIAGDPDMLQALKELEEDEELDSNSKDDGVEIAGKRDEVEAVADRRPSNLFVAKQIAKAAASDDEADA